MTNTMQVDDGAGRGRVVSVTYPPNSEKAKKAAASQKVKPKQEAVVTGKVVQKRRWSNRFKESMLGEGGVEGAVETLVTDILVGALKGMISDAVSQTSAALRDGVDRFLYGDIRRQGRERTGGTYNYSKVRRYQPNYGTISTRERGSHDFNGVILETRIEAQKVLDGLHEIITEFGVADVGDFYDLVGITGEFTDNNWGWYDLEGAVIRPVRGGYTIHLPRTRPID